MELEEQLGHRLANDWTQGEGEALEDGHVMTHRHGRSGHLLSDEACADQDDTASGSERRQIVAKRDGVVQAPQSMHAGHALSPWEPSKGRAGGDHHGIGLHGRSIGERDLARR